MQQSKSIKGGRLSKKHLSYISFSRQLAVSHASKLSETRFQHQYPLKMSILMKKLKHVGNHSTLQTQYLTNSIAQQKESKSRLTSKSNIYYEEVRQSYQRQNARHREKIAQLELSIQFLTKKQRQEANWSIYQHKFSVQIDQIERYLQRIREKISNTSSLKPRFRIFKSLQEEKPICEMQRPSNQNDKSRKQTVSSIFKDGSLLLSFKKNVEEDDGYFTLKYSEQSAKERNIEKDWEPVTQSFQPNIKTDQPKVRRKLDYKDQIAQPQIMELSSYQFQKNHYQSISILSKKKQEITNAKIQIENGYQIYEGILQKFIETIAEQKVESQQQWLAIFELSSKELLSLNYQVKKMRQEEQIASYQLINQIQVLNNRISDAVTAQRKEREQQERGMIKMMLQVVQFLQ